MPYKPEDVESKLRQKFGFQSASGHEKNHTWLVYQGEGWPRVVKTKIEHHVRAMGPGLEGKITKQLRVRAPFFREMMDCTKGADQYTEQVARDPFPPWEKFGV